MSSAATLDRLRPLQVQGVRWLAANYRHNRALCLFDDPGLGKTLQALSLIDLMDWQRVLVVSPAGARRVWYNQIVQWYPHWKDRIIIVEPGAHADWHDLARPGAIVLVAYDSLSQKDSIWPRHIADAPWDFLAIDEAHYLKNPSRRTRALFGSHGSDRGIQASATKVLLMSGTPTPNHLGELWQAMRTLWPQTLTSLATGERPMSEAEFIERVCVWKDNPKFGRQIVGSTQAGTQLVRDRLGPFVRRVSKAQALPELPPVTEQDVPIVMPFKELDQLPPEVQRLHATLSRKSDDELWRAMRAVPRDDDNETTQLSTLRRALGELKVGGTVEWVRERLECGTGKLLIFGWHVRALSRLHQLLAEYEPVLITGATSPDERQTVIERFQKRAFTRVFVGQIQAAGTAITLTAASEVVIFEPSWVPGENRQAIDRAHRLGQPKHVLAHYLYLPGTLDHRILQVMRRKHIQTGNLFNQGVPAVA